MIRLSDATVLAVAKLRSHKNKTLLSVVVAGLLFGVLLAAIIVSRGVLGSVETFSNASLDGRHLVLASTLDTLDDQLANDPSLIKKARAQQLAATIEGADTQSVTRDHTNPDGSVVTSLNLQSPIAQKVIADYRAAHPSNDIETVKKIAAPYHQKNIYEIQGLNLAPGTRVPADKLSGSQAQLFDQGQLPYVVDGSILRPFRLPAKATSSPANTISIVIPYSMAEAKLRLKKLPSGASPTQKLNRLKEVRQKAVGAQFSQTFQVEDRSDQLRVVFQVAGITPDNRTGQSNRNLSQIVLSLLSPPGFGFATLSRHEYQRISHNNQLKGLFSLSPSTSNALNTKNYLIEFNKFNDMAEFIGDHTCADQSDCSGINSFSFSQFGSSSFQLSQLTRSLEKIFIWAAVVVALVGVIILGGNFGKVIADGRRETAVFRALGAKHSDIVTIYVIYSVLLAILTIIFALVIGYVCASLGEILLVNQLTAELQLTYGLTNSALSAHIVSFPSLPMFLVALLILTASVLSMSLSLIKNVNRDITADLKDE